jgi:hypothetical protein
MTFKKIVFFTVTSLVLNLGFWADTNAASLNLTCRVGIGGTRSIIRMHVSGLKGKYYAKVFSGENIMQSEDQTTDAKGSFDFKFHSDPSFITSNPDSIKIAPDFIVKREVIGVLRKAETHARIAAIRARCRIARVQ